jgi:hypothetical protein
MQIDRDGKFQIGKTSDFKAANTEQKCRSAAIGEQFQPKMLATLTASEYKNYVRNPKWVVVGKPIINALEQRQSFTPALSQIHFMVLEIQLSANSSLWTGLALSTASCSFTAPTRSEEHKTGISLPQR